MEIILPQKSPKIFSCEKCDFNCRSKKDYNRHLGTRKHKMELNGNNGNENYPSFFLCESCNKQFKSKSGLWKHTQKCNLLKKSNKEENKKEENKKEENKKEENEIEYKEIINSLINENKELHKTLREIVPTIGNNNNNNINNQFNINVFLNEDCKDALNIKDFVSSLQLQLKDLDNTGKLGFVEGTSKIFIDGLNKLEITKRPIHCSDIAEETLYIKDNDTWEKETKNKDKMKQAIDEITDANMKQMPEWIKRNPSFSEDEEYMKVISNIMNVMDTNNHNKQKEKIINNVAKETLIDE